MFAQIKIGLERHTNTWLLPVAAIVTEKSGHAVFILAEGKAKRLPVKIGFNDGSSAEVLEGLAPEQTVILAGTKNLSGQPVLIAEEGS
jgi:membrane fusion protein (multidrug efflux system)